MTDPHDAREHPESYRVARGEQGVLTVEPYKSELLPLWRFATPDKARSSAVALTERFHAYLEAGDLVGADMARKLRVSLATWAPRGQDALLPLDIDLKVAVFGGAEDLTYDTAVIGTQVGAASAIGVGTLIITLVILTGLMRAANAVVKEA